MLTSRREFLYWLAGSGITALGHPALTRAGVPGPGRQPSTWVRLLADAFDNKTSARIVGGEYLRSHPAEADASWLADQIFQGDISSRIQYLGSEKADRKALIKRRIQEDFRLGRIVHVRTWMLSQTEARLCALAVLA